MQWAKKQTSSGFTIVELLIVVVVIAILAAITIVAYGAVRNRATESLLANTAEYVAKEMQNRRTLEGANTFADTLPANLDLPEGVGVATTDTGDDATFCINVTHQNYGDIYYSIRNDAPPQKGELCEGEVVASSAEYNELAGTNGEVALVREVCADMYNFCIERDNTYDALSLTWDSQGGDVTYYNLHSREPDGTWYVHQVSGGASGWSAGTTSNGYTNRIPSGTTSMNWTHSSTIPQPGTSREFRFRHYTSSTSTYSSWTYVTLTREELPTIPNFDITPSSNWSDIQLTWDSPGEQSDYRGFYYNVHSRDPEGTWYVHQISGGNGGYPSGTTNAGYTNRIPGDTTSMSWTNAGAIPQPGTSREFRIRAYTNVSGGSGGDIKAGPWTTFTLTRSALPAVSGFTVTPNGSWSNITLSWDDAAGVSDDNGFYYNIHSREPEGTWYVHNLGSGSGTYSSGTTSGGYTNRISNDTTSLSWTSSSVIPSSGTSREFRIRAYTTVSGGSGGANQAGPWTTFTLTRP